MKICLFGFLFLLTSIISNAQCDDEYTLCTQSDVDSFFINYGPCTVVNRLIIGGDFGTCEDISDLTPLLGIRKVNNLSFARLPNLISMDGLDSLVSIGVLINSSGNSSFFNGFKNLRRIDQLRHTFTIDEDLNGTTDLSMYGIDSMEISEGLIIQRDVKLRGLHPSTIPNRSENPDFVLSIINNTTYNDFTELMPADIEHFSRFGIIGSLKDSLSLKGLENIKTFRSLALNDVEDLDIEVITHVETDKLGFTDYIDKNDKTKFGSVVTLEGLLIDNYQDLEKIEEVLPNLNSVTEALIIQNNLDVDNLDFLNDFQWSQKLVESMDFSPRL